MARILFVGPKPPPTFGYSSITVQLSDLLVREGHNVRFCSTVPHRAAKLYPGKAWRIVRFLYLFPAVVRFLASLPGRELVYLNVNSGPALFFDAIAGGIARLAGKRLFVHHNSFGYLNDPSRLAAIAFWVAGAKATHIVNCKKMSKRLKRCYSFIHHIVEVSNVSILRDLSGYPPTRAVTPRPQNHELTVGFMGYITEEKGPDLFCQTIAAAVEKGAQLNAILVGPPNDPDMLKKLKADYSRLVCFENAKYGAEKDSFFSAIDLFLFPSKYRTEAEALVLYDANSAGVPVFGTDVGCTCEVLEAYRHSQSVPIAAYLDRVSDMLVTWSREATPELLAERRAETLRDYTAQGKRRLESFRRYLELLRSTAAV